MAKAPQSAYDRVKLARQNGRPTGSDYIEHMFTDFIELHGDRRYSDDTAIIGGIGYLDDRPVTVIAIEKGRNPKERIAHNFGAPHPEGYRKALRLMKQAEKFKRPVICFVDTSGAYCGIGAEERGQGQAIAENMMEMMGLKTPIISILIGEGGSGGALALSVADRVWMLENSIYSVISPEGCASILWKDSGRAEDAANSLKLTAADALSMSVVEQIIPENDIGKDVFYDKLQAMISRELRALGAMSVDELTEKRYGRFRRLGTPDPDMKGL
ncbi:MAG: acetyl-CoA carboxylase carboxyltransferase subunit alpha [Oscillospiraceae bacterium]